MVGHPVTIHYSLTNSVGFAQPPRQHPVRAPVRWWQTNLTVSCLVGKGAPFMHTVDQKKVQPILLLIFANCYFQKKIKPILLPIFANCCFKKKSQMQQTWSRHGANSVCKQLAEF